MPLACNYTQCGWKELPQTRDPQGDIHLSSTSKMEGIECHLCGRFSNGLRDGVGSEGGREAQKVRERDRERKREREEKAHHSLHGILFKITLQPARKQHAYILTAYCTKKWNRLVCCSSAWNAKLLGHLTCQLGSSKACLWSERHG